jgi:hypothetical protein
MAKNTLKTRKSHVQIDWNGDVNDELAEAIANELRPVMDEIVMSAKMRVSVGGKRKGPPKWRPVKDGKGNWVKIKGKDGKKKLLLVDVNSPRDPRDVYKQGSGAGRSWTSRKPGRLRDTIHVNYVGGTRKKDAVVGYVTAGDGGDVYYEIFKEYGFAGLSTKGATPDSVGFLRPALAEFSNEAVEAIARGISKATGNV